MPRILLAEDDVFYAQSYRSVLEEAGFDVVEATDATSGLIAFEKDPDGFAAAVVDMAMSPGPRFSALEARSGFHAGLALSRSIVRRKHDARVIGLTGIPDDQIIRWFKDKRFPLLIKQRSTPRQLLDYLASAASLSKPPDPRKCFIVHGHDTSAVDDLKKFIGAQLPAYAPVVLSESKSGGLTVIEKFEEYAETAFIAFVLMTPDDQVVDSSGKVIGRRARQNVIFELGYFLGRLGRSNGRVLILTKGDVEIPSDIVGVVSIDISSGILASANQILTEIET